jgi:hypothetical protein
MPSESLEQQRRHEIREATDQALLEMQKKEEAMERRIEARSMQLQEMTKSKAASEEIQRLQSDITILQRTLEEVRTLKTDAVDRVLALSQQKQEEVLMEQERRHIEAMNRSQTQSSATLLSLSSDFITEVRVITQQFSDAVAESNKETVKALREVGAGVQASIASVNNLAVSNQKQFFEMSSFMQQGFQALIACEEGRSRREEARMLREEEREARAEARMQRYEDGEAARLQREERRDRQLENLTSVFKNSVTEVRILHIITSIFKCFVQSTSLTQYIYQDKQKQLHSLFKSGCRLEGGMSALNALGIVTKPVPSYPRPAPVGSNEAAGSSEMHSRMGTPVAGNLRPPSPAYFSSGGSPEQQSEIQPVLSAELVRLLNDNPDELQRLWGMLKGPNKPK